MKSSRARGPYSLIHRHGEVLGLVYGIAEKRSICVYRFANVGNHLHFLVRARRRRDLQAYLRELAGKIVVLVTCAVKGRPGKLWDPIAWSNLLEWGRQFSSTARYILLNQLEAGGHRDRALLELLERDGAVYFAASRGS